MTTLTTEDRYALWLGRAYIARGKADTAKQGALDAIRQAARALQDEGNADAIDEALAATNDGTAAYLLQRGKLADCLAKAEHYEQQMQLEAGLPSAPAALPPPPPIVEQVDEILAALEAAEEASVAHHDEEAALAAAALDLEEDDLL